MRVTFVNARLSDGRLTSLSVLHDRITAVGDPPDRRDTVVDLCGDRLLPGLINAHDHLQLNALPPLETQTRYSHVKEWIAAIDGRRRTDPLFEARVAVPRADRLLLGGIKNLLSGVTTVAHHDPLYPSLTRAEFPVAVVKDYGWSHSLYLDGESSVRQSHAATPRQQPWVIHAAEGVCADAAAEFDRLEALGCVTPNAVLIHGIALDSARRLKLRAAGAGLVWCPSSNLRLFGTTVDVADLLPTGHVALGTDSRLSGARDLLEELRTAHVVSGMSALDLESTVTTVPARLFHLADRGALQPGLRADLLVIPGDLELINTSRAQIKLVLFGGEFRCGDRAYARAFSAIGQEVTLDGQPKFLSAGLAMQMKFALLAEPGLLIPHTEARAA